MKRTGLIVTVQMNELTHSRKIRAILKIWNEIRSLFSMCNVCLYAHNGLGPKIYVHMLRKKVYLK